MSPRPPRGRLPRWLRRCWPQRVRTRLTLLYAGLFFVAGSALLGLTYGLVAHSLPDLAPVKPPPMSANQRAKLEILCRQPATDPGTKEECSREFNAGAQAGSRSQRERALHDLLVYSLAGLGAMTVIAGGLGWLVAGRVLRPVRVITETARRASEQHLGERLALAGPKDELRELADTFDGMLERLDRAFTTQRRFAANASHELRTPLTVMRTAIDVTLAKPGRTPQQLEDMAARVRRSIGRAEDMIDALLTLAATEQGPGSTEFVDLATAAEDAVDAAGAGIERLGLRVETSLEPAETAGDPQLLERMIGNLVDNAVQHNQPGGWIRVYTSGSGPAARFRVANSGPVIPADAVPSLFEPFRRLAGRTGPGGSGLGLSIAQSVAAAHGAVISARSQADGGLDVEVEMPRPLGTNGPALPGPAPPGPAPPGP